VDLHGRGGQVRRVPLPIAHGLDRDPPQGGRVRVEAEDDLAASFLDERGEPVSEGENALDPSAVEAFPARLGRPLLRD
jgi:hypothetical protein